MDALSTDYLQQYIIENNVENARQLADAVGDHRNIRSIQRDIQKRGLVLCTQKLTQRQVNHIIADELPRLGPVYGRKTMTGHLRSIGYNIGEGRVGKALKLIDPDAHRRREVGTSRQLNPLSYHAPYFGYNYHIDQNEKLVDYGVVICGLVDGCSNFLLGFNVMNRKNPIQIYSDLFFPVVDQFGLPDCLISDCGREFALIQHVQCAFSGERVDGNGILSQRPAMKQLRSTENNRIERIWVMVNDRCTFPIKNILCSLHENGRINMLDEEDKNAVSFIARKICELLLGRLRESWNHHSIPYHGKPIDKLITSKAYQVTLPPWQDAVDVFTQEGGQLTMPWVFGVDNVLEEFRDARDEEVRLALGGLESLANKVVGDDAEAVADAIDCYRNISRQYALQ